MRPHIIYCLYICMCACVCVLYTFFMCILCDYVSTYHRYWTHQAHPWTCKFFSLYYTYIVINNIYYYMIHITYLYVYIFFTYFTRYEYIIHTLLVTHRSKLWLKFSYNHSFPHYIKRRFVVFCIHILFVHKNSNTVYKSFLAASLWRMDQEYIIIIILCLLKSI